MNSAGRTTRAEADRLVRDVHDLLELFVGLTDSIAEQIADAVHFQAGVMEVSIDTIPMRMVADLRRQIGRLPGNPPRTSLPGAPRV